MVWFLQGNKTTINDQAIASFCCTSNQYIAGKTHLNGVMKVSYDVTGVLLTSQDISSLKPAAVQKLMILLYGVFGAAVGLLFVILFHVNKQSDINIMDERLSNQTDSISRSQFAL